MVRHRHTFSLPRFVFLPVVRGNKVCRAVVVEAFFVATPSDVVAFEVCMEPVEVSDISQLVTVPVMGDTVVLYSTVCGSCSVVVLTLAVFCIVGEFCRVVGSTQLVVKRR